MNRIQVFESLPEWEQEDFQKCCEHHRYNRKEFEVSCGEDLAYSTSVRTVTVTRNGYSKRYDAGKGTDWIVQFDDDLQLQYFGN
jgi:hypothetical protein